ncbi:hypothetical protein TUMSATVNIG1_06160 [Vibrio nigripulchritudo]|uniref:YbaN family protein n=1 Tax=Vibrio nigripulchritudo TaxID=28173 RepID=UPI00190920A5|nr:YbaN family protein [Vibrio nigripulchritudo]BCL68676.1 hypothetical protein VNTUMSATTG_06130 [Vibrio nigripulchritudo]BDU30007.1 hypothetical protein TUMSATVNIG1_06160 [Vibrio nigripulchritudo]
MEKVQSNTSISNGKRIFLITLGWLTVALAFIGVFVPLLPTVPFLLVTLYCFGATSEKFQTWLLNNKYLGPIANRLKNKQGLTKAEKIQSLILIWLSMGAVLFFLAWGTHWQYGIISLLIFETWFILRFKSYVPE